MSWTAPACMKELKERLEAWGDLSTVDVNTAPIATKVTSKELLVFVRAPGTQNWAAIGNQTKTDDYTIEGTLTVARQGLSEAVAVTVRDRAQAIIDALEDCLRDIVRTPGTFAADIGATQIRALNLSNVTLDAQGANDGARWVKVDFDIDVSATI